MNKALFVKVVKAERKMFRIFGKDTSTHTIKNIIFNMRVMREMKIKYMLYEFLTEQDFEELYSWSSRKMFKF